MAGDPEDQEYWSGIGQDPNKKRTEEVKKEHISGGRRNRHGKTMRRKSIHRRGHKKSMVRGTRKQQKQQRKQRGGDCVYRG